MCNVPKDIDPSLKKDPVYEKLILSWVIMNNKVVWFTVNGQKHRKYNK